MELSKEEFNEQFRDALDYLLKEMAEHPEIDLKRFGSMACFLENLSFFSPVLYSLVEESKK
ncbi:hypothetical protein [Nafulsella turpanensis]|uniref:hypothetical protein n=1 Tax=Nafulsella turpanensis TaxID=1265690 RepID=UPI000344A6E1|nr:hypothetical protein [Nafulsella turpanensis]